MLRRRRAVHQADPIYRTKEYGVKTGA